MSAPAPPRAGHGHARARSPGPGPLTGRPALPRARTGTADPRVPTGTADHSRQLHPERAPHPPRRRALPPDEFTTPAATPGGIR
ncbi:hypothetical protein [Streptomyces sp. NPDC054765]